MYGNGVCETNLNAKNCPEGYALVQEFFLKNGAERLMVSQISKSLYKIENKTFFYFKNYVLSRCQ